MVLLFILVLFLLSLIFLILIGVFLILVAALFIRQSFSQRLNGILKSLEDIQAGCCVSDHTLGG